MPVPPQEPPHETTLPEGRSALGAFARRFSGFTLISGIGFLIDVALVVSLLQAGIGIFYANLVGAFCGVSFVFFAAREQIFAKARGRPLAPLLMAYWVWQAVAITAASALAATIAAALAQLWPAEGEVAHVADHALLADTVRGAAAKALVTPATLVANFFFMQYLLERQTRI